MSDTWVNSATQRFRSLLPKAKDLRAVRRKPRRDLLAGLTVAMVALPLALAFGNTSGMGASAGLVTAIVAGVLAAVFGGSNFQVSGPTGAMTVVLVPVVAHFGPTGVLTVGLMAGVILLILAILRAGRYIKFIPLPVIEGFTVGIAAVIALQQFPAALGVERRGNKVLMTAAYAVVDWLGNPQWVPILLTLCVAGLVLFVARFRPGLPVSLAAVAAATLVVVAAGVEVETIGAIPSGLPMPSIPGVPFADLSSLLLPAVAVAALAALESLLSASVADAMSVGERHDSDRELFGQGIANLASPLFGGIPATGAIARTAVNVRAGAHSRLSAVAQSVILLLVVLVGSQFVEQIPLAALAGVLMATTIQMVQVSSIRALMGSTRGDALVLVVTALATVFLDLVTAVILGLFVAGGYALQQVAKAARIEEMTLDTGDHVEEEVSLLDEHIVAFRLEGALFFGAAHAFLLELSEISDVRVVILRMSRLSTLDATGAAVLADTIGRLESRGITVLLSGIRSEHSQVLDQLSVYDSLAHEKHVFASTPSAIAHARRHAGRHEPRSHHNQIATSDGAQPQL